MDFGPGECFGICFSIVLRASVARLEFAFDYFRWVWLFASKGPMGKIITWVFYVFYVLSILLPALFRRAPVGAPHAGWQPHIEGATVD